MPEDQLKQDPIGKSIALFYQKMGSTDVNVYKFNTNGEKIALEPIALGIKLESFSCQNSKDQILCLVFGNQSTIKQMTLNYISSPHKTFEIVSTQSYKFYQDFSYNMSELVFNEEVMAIKASRNVIPENGVTQKQDVILIYSQSFRPGQQNELLAYGLNTEDYYNSKITPDNKSQGVPMLFNDKNGQTCLAFSQNLITAESNPTTSPFRVFHYTNELQIALNADFDVDQVANTVLTFNSVNAESSINQGGIQIQLNKIFTGKAEPVPSSSSSSSTSSSSSSSTEEPTGSDSLWITLWIVITVLFTVAVGLIVYFLKLGASIEIDEEDGYSKEGENEPIGRDNSVSDTEKGQETMGSQSMISESQLSKNEDGLM